MHLKHLRSRREVWHDRQHADIGPQLAQKQNLPLGKADRIIVRCNLTMGRHFEKGRCDGAHALKSPTAKRHQLLSIRRGTLSEDGQRVVVEALDLNRLLPLNDLLNHPLVLLIFLQALYVHGLNGVDDVIKNWDLSNLRLWSKTREKRRQNKVPGFVWTGMVANDSRRAAGTPARHSFCAITIFIITIVVISLLSDWS